MRFPAERLLAVLAIVLFLPACEQNTDQEPADQATVADAQAAPVPCHLVMGWDPWEPYQFRDAGGAVRGLDIEIAEAAAAAAGCDLEFRQAAWMELVGRLQAGDIQMVAGATRTAGREAYAAFTGPYRTESFVVYALADNKPLREAKDLKVLLSEGTRVGTVADYYYGDDINDVLDALTAAGRLREASVSELNYERLEAGEIDAFFDDPFVASSILRNRPHAKRIAATGMMVTSGDVAFMMSKAGAGADDIRRFSDGVEAIRANGTLAEILARWRARD